MLKDKVDTINLQQFLKIKMWFCIVSKWKIQEGNQQRHLLYQWSLQLLFFWCTLLSTTYNFFPLIYMALNKVEDARNQLLLLMWSYNLSSKKTALLKLMSSLRSKNTEEFSRWFRDGCYLNIHQKTQTVYQICLSNCHTKPPLPVLPFMQQVFPYSCCLCWHPLFPYSFLLSLFGYNTWLF